MDADADRHALHNGHSLTHCLADADINLYAHPHADAHRVAYAYPHSYFHTHPCVLPDPHAHPDADVDTDTVRGLGPLLAPGNPGLHEGGCWNAGKGSPTSRPSCPLPSTRRAPTRGEPDHGGGLAGEQVTSAQGGRDMRFEEVATERFTRLLHPYPTFLVTCAGRDGRANVITIAWLIPVSVRPPLLTMAVRRERYSYGLIVESGEFVVHALPFDRAREALFCGRRSGRDVDKIAALGLRSVPGRVVKAPVLPGIGVAFLECRLRREVEAGDHVLFIAEVVAAYARPAFLKDGVRDLVGMPPLLHVGGNRFATTSPEVVEPPV